jgi:ferredoxin--NADP+ reductase
MSKAIRVAIFGAGPAGIYAGNILANSYPNVTIDLFDLLPAPYGLIRYGVAPDHPRIKGIVNSLHEMLDAGTIRFFGNVEFGKDITLEDVKRHYHAVIFATGAIKDAQHSWHRPGWLLRSRRLRELVRRPPRCATHLATYRREGGGSG